MKRPVKPQTRARYSLRLEGTLDRGLLVAREAHMAALKSALKTVGDEVKEALRDDLDRAFESKVTYTWRGEVFPTKGLAKEPAYQIWSQVPNLIESHDLGVTILPVAGKYLWVPVRNGPMDHRRTKGGDRRSFAKALAAFGQTRFIPARPGRPAMIVGETKATEGRGVTAMTTPMAKGRYPARYAMVGGPVTVPLFWLLPKARMKKALDASAIIARAGRTAPEKLRAAYKTALAAELAKPRAPAPAP